MNIDRLNKLKHDFDLSPFVTLKTQTRAQFFFEATSKNDIVAAFLAAKKDSIPLFFLGGGSNLVILKKRIDGLVVRNRYIEKKIISDNHDEAKIKVSAGYPASLLVKELNELGCSGLEYQLGLPGTVGGAIYMNSKWTKPVCYFSDNLETADLLDGSGQIKTVDHDYFQFAYDYSILQKTKELLLDATFKFKKVSTDILKARSEEALAYRKKTQPFGVFSSGCFFKNIDNQSAGKLIDEAGLKGVAIGDYVVSTTHANFILNNGKGKPEDLKKLLALIKERVFLKSGVKLEEEVIIIE